jgi:hypothetical protein
LEVSDGLIVSAVSLAQSIFDEQAFSFRIGTIGKGQDERSISAVLGVSDGLTN